jgi:hypothetical protein
VSLRGPERVSGEPNDIRYVGYQFYSDFSTENIYRVKVALEFQIRLPQGDPWGSRGPGSPLRVSKKPNDARHVGYQFYLDFSTENKYRVNTPLKFQIRLQWGGIWRSRGAGAPFWGSSKNLMMHGILGINSTQISVLKTNTGSTHL